MSSHAYIHLTMMLLCTIVFIRPARLNFITLIKVFIFRHILGRLLGMLISLINLQSGAHCYF